MGLAFTGLVAVWALLQYDVGDGDGDGDGDDVRWLLPVPWIVAGAAGLIASAYSARGHGRRQTGWVQPADPGPTSGTETDPYDTDTDITQEIR